MFLGLQIFVWIKFRGVVYRFDWMVFHLSRTWVQNGLLILKHRVSVFWVRKAKGGKGVEP